MVVSNVLKHDAINRIQQGTLPPELSYWRLLLSCHVNSLRLWIPSQDSHKRLFCQRVLVTCEIETNVLNMTYCTDLLCHSLLSPHSSHFLKKLIIIFLRHICGRHKNMSKTDPQLLYSVAHCKLHQDHTSCCPLEHCCQPVTECGRDTKAAPFLGETRFLWYLTLAPDTWLTLPNLP